VAGDSSRKQAYVPIKAYPALFRTFATLEPTEEAILRFSQRFGWLSRPEEIELDEYGKTTRYEPISIWIEEITEMKYVVTLWDMSQNQDQEGLKRFIDWKKFVRIEFKEAPDEEMEFLAGHLLGPRSFSSHIPERDYLLPSISQIMHLVNNSLSNRVNLALHHSHDGQMKLELEPRDLLACMWVQFAKSINENKKHRKCLGCDLWFEIGGQGGRPDKTYCGDACRMRFNRETQEKTKIRKKRKK
jgi:hypothetical protein